MPETLDIKEAMKKHFEKILKARMKPEDFEILSIFGLVKVKATFDFEFKYPEEDI